MALQQPAPEFTPAAGLGSYELKHLKRMLPPAAASFRRGGSLAELVAKVGSSRSLQIDASAGAGKSTVVPGEILKAYGGLLIHVLPSGFLAASLHEYLSKSNSNCYLVTSPADTWPADGWVVTSAAVLQTYMLAKGSLELPECILYHDEVHRSDCWTFCLAKQWGSIAGVKKYITASATAGVGEFRRLETGGSLEQKTYDAKHLDGLWDVNGDGSLPWHVSALSGNLLVFEDRAEHAKHLISEYSHSGFDVYRLHSRMKPRVFQAAMRSLASDEMTVLIADSTFRDGYTFDLSVIIDSGKIETTSVVSGQPARVLRDAYEGEIYQGSARGARTAGSHCVSWKPTGVFQRKRVALEAVEVDAVALICRLLGLLVPVEAMDSIMAEGQVPRDLVGALIGSMPLACLSDTQLVDMTTTGYVRSPSPVLATGYDMSPGLDYYNSGVSADRANALQFAKRVDAESVDERDSGVSGVSDTGSGDWTSELATWASARVGDNVNLECGGYYYSPSVKPDKVASSEFPEGWASVQRLLTRESASVVPSDLSVYARGVAVAAGLQRYNMLSCEKNAIVSLARDVSAVGRSRSAPMVHSWMNQLLERANAVSVESIAVARILEPLVDGFCVLEQLPDDCLAEQCRALSNGLFESIRSIPVADVTAEYASGVLKSSIPVPLEAPKRVPVVRGASDARYVEMSRKGHAARAKPTLSAFGRWVAGYQPARVNSAIDVKGRG